jgi:CRISPR/Cas system-associated exonuclease Cas4 (RecB family)
MSATVFRTPTGKVFQPAPDVLVLNASSLREFASCRLRFFLSSVLGLRGQAENQSGDFALDRSGELPDEGSAVDSGADSSAAAVGMWVHSELHARHENPGRHGDPGIVGEEVSTSDTRILQAVAHHHERCPGSDGATYLGGERNLRWLITRKSILLTGRVDALWLHDDGVVEVRDYKTGSPSSALEDDEGALVYALLAAANFPGRRVRITYEYLGVRSRREVTELNPDSRLLSLYVTPQLLRHAMQLVDDTASSIRKEQVFTATPTTTGCRSCPYRLNCQPAAEWSRSQRFVEKTRS